VSFAIRGFHPEVSPSNFIFRRTESVRKKGWFRRKMKLERLTNAVREPRSVVQISWLRRTELPGKNRRFFAANMKFEGLTSAWTRWQERGEPESAEFPAGGVVCNPRFHPEVSRSNFLVAADGVAWQE
jgi:hypothetical protein